MAKKNFVVHKGTTVGAANIDAATGDLVTGGNITANGSATITGNITANGSATITGNITANSNVTIHGTASIAGDTLGANIYQNGNQVLDVTSRIGAQVERRNYSYTTPQWQQVNTPHEFVLELGIAVIVYQLTVSRPVKVEIFGSADYSEANPYTFVATSDHLTDDGTVLLSNGSIIQSRQYSIFANLEEPPVSRVYARMTNIDNETAPVTLSLLYFSAVTDNRPSRDVDVVVELPVTGHTGKLVYLSADNKMYIYVNGNWSAVSS